MDPLEEPHFTAYEQVLFIFQNPPSCTRDREGKVSPALVREFISDFLDCEALDLFDHINGLDFAEVERVARQDWRTVIALIDLEENRRRLAALQKRRAQIEKDIRDYQAEQARLAETPHAEQAAEEPKSNMSTTNTNIIPHAPADFKSDDGTPNFRVLGSLSQPVMRKIEPYGAQFLAHARRKRHGRTFSEDDRIQQLSRVKKTEDDDAGEISEPEDPLMLQRDAKDWKGQDHYAVLGLSKYRYKATDEQIKKAHRKKVLKHHPDKKAAAGQDDENDSFFKCIQRANEILTDPVKRRQFDSVDEAADVQPPTKKDVTKPSAFYKKWRAVFESEARFSKVTPVPNLGDDNSTKEDVETFYDFWYNFDSWRTFEYLDEDVPDDNEGRDHKRHIEKKNANARRKRKSEDIARLRKLVDDCLGMDDRIKKFRKAASANKNKRKIEKEEAAKREAEDKARAKEEEDRKKKEDEEKAKVERDQGKKAKEAAKNAVKKNKRVVKGSVKDANYFVQGEASAKQVDSVLDDVDKVLATIDADELAALVSKLNVAGKDAEKVKTVFTDTTGGLVSGGKLKESDLKVFN